MHSPYARDVSGSISSRPSRAAGLCTPGVSTQVPDHESNAAQNCLITPRTSGAPNASSSGIRRLFTPISVASSYLLEQVGSFLGSISPPVPQQEGKSGLNGNNQEPLDSANISEEPETRVSPDLPLRSEAEEIPTHGKKITPHHVEDRSRQPGSGSLLATLKRDACTHLQSCPKRPMTARAESTSRESHAHSAGQRGTPYSSVLQLLMEGPGSMQQRNTRADGGALSAMRFGMSSYGSRHFVELKPQTPTPGFSAPGFGTDPYTGAGLFCMGSLPSSMDASYRRSARRSAQAVRTPVSATPMLQLPSLNELHGGNEHQETTKQPRAPSWTPMRSSTVALVDKFEQRDMPTSKRARPQSPVANASSTPLIGSGISSLQSYALQTPVYRRRVRACHESVASRHKEGLPALPPALDEEQQVESNASRLSTETARRILMTLRSMASKPGTEAKSVKFIEPSVSGNGGKMSPSSASSKQTIHSQMTPALDVVPESTLSQENRVTTGWDSAFLGANAASSAAATKAVADEIAKHSAGNCRGGISARQPCMTKGTDEDKGNHILGLCHGLQVNVYQVSKTAGANPAAASSAAAAVCTDPMKQQYSLAAEPGVSECLSADGVGTPLCFSDKPEESLAATRSEAFADGRNCVPTFESGMGIPPSLESLQGSTSLKSETLSGEQSPIFRFGGKRDTGRDKVVKDITMGCVPAGVIPKYRFGAVSATLSRTFMHAPSAEPQKMDQVDMKAAQSVAEAAGVPLPDEDGDNDEDVCKSKTSALEHSTGTSMLNPRNTSMHAGFTAPIGQVDGMVLSAGSGERSHKQDRQVQHKVSAAANEPMGNTAALSAGQSITSVSPTEGGAFFNVDAPAQDSALDTINLDAVKASTISSPGLSRFGAQVPLAVPSVQNLPVLSESVPVATNGWGDPYSAKIKLEVADAAQKHISDDLQCVPSGMADTAAGTTSNTMLGAPSATPARSAAPEFLLAGATSTTSDKPASSVPISFDSLGHENFKPPLVPVDSAGANPPPGGYSGSSVICAVKSNSVDVTCTGLAAPATALLENCDDRWNSGGVSFCVAKGPGQREGGPTVHGVIEGGSMLSSPFNFGGSSSMATSNTVQPPGSAPLSTFAFGTFGVDLKPSGSNTLGPAYSVAPPVFTPGNAVTSFSGTAQPLNAGAITSSSFSTGQASFGASTCSSFQSAVMTSAPQAFFGTSGSKSNTSFFGCQTSNVVGITSAVVGFGQQPQEVGCGPSSNVFRFGSTSNSKPESAGSILFGSQSGLPNTLQAQTNPFGGPLTHDTQGSTSAFSFGVEQQNPSSHLVQQQSNQPVGFTMGGGEVLQQGARRVVKARRRLRGK